MDNEDAKPARLTRWIHSETRRSVVSAVAATIITAPIATAWLINEPALRDHAGVVGCVLSWTLFAAGHAVLTHRAFGRLDAARLRAILVPGSSAPDSRGDAQPADDEHPKRRTARLAAATRRWWDWWWRGGNEAPSWSVQVSVLALIVVALIMLTPTLRNSQGLLFAALAMVSASWINVVVMYALHYARLDLRQPGLTFPGDEPRRFVDYLYFALALQTTFGTTDVTVMTQRLRRVTIGHGGLAFAFNSVIVAMIVSLLLGVAT